MQNHYLKREAEKLLKEARGQFPAILVTGPRQAGKTTLLQKYFKDYSWASLDDLDVRRTAIHDPEYFLSQFPPPVVIDEIQYAPNLLSYIKIHIDKNRRAYGQFILIGSQTFQVMQGVSESLAGRIAIFDLYPLTWKETLAGSSIPTGAAGDALLLKNLLRGFYPELHIEPKIRFPLWFKSYLQTYIERDVRDIKAIMNLHDFQAFVKLLAPRTGQLLNLAEVGKEVGISQTTAKEWLSILESTYIIRLLRPYHNNHTKRMIKSPKLYFVDTGLLCNLLAITSQKQLSESPFLGSIFENMCIMEVVKHLDYSLSPIQPFFYRDSSKLEIDLIIKTNTSLQAYEIKFAKSLRKSMGENLKAFQKLFPEAKLHLVSLSEKGLGFPGIESLHWSELLPLSLTGEDP